MGGRTNFNGSCLRYYARRKMIASRMVFVRLFFREAQILGVALNTASDYQTNGLYRTHDNPVR